MVFNPLELGKKVAQAVCKGNKRLYHRFRGGSFYGGIATADVVGCNLRCAFCWSWRSSHLVPRNSKLMTPEEVASKLIEIAHKRGYRLARITGGEPTLCPQHLLEVIDILNREGLLFILETNGILLGYEKELAKEIARRNVFVRISIKAPTPRAFSKITGASEEFFEYPLKAFENLIEAGHPVKMMRAAVVLGYGTEREYAELLERLASIHPELADVEWEVITLYPSVRRRLEKRGLLPSVYSLP